MKKAEIFSNETPIEKSKANQFIVVTPARNEESMLPNLFSDMNKQTNKPKLWVIVDDLSSDGTWTVIEEMEKSDPWIVGLRLGLKQATNISIHERIIYVIRQGFKTATDICLSKNFKPKFFAVIDADVKLENSYFEKIFRAFEANPSLGIASGYVFEEGMSLIDHNVFNLKPRGCALVFRRECLEMIGGYQGDSNSLLKAQNRKWQVATIKTARIIHRRKTWSRKNYFYSKGRYAYFINYHPLNAVLTGSKYCLDNPSNGVAYLKGYFNSYFLKTEKTADEEIKEYYALHSFIYRLYKGVLREGR